MRRSRVSSRLPDFPHAAGPEALDDLVPRDGLTDHDAQVLTPLPFQLTDMIVRAGDEGRELTEEERRHFDCYSVAIEKILSRAGERGA